jgi:hypothetical protein
MCDSGHAGARGEGRRENPSLMSSKAPSRSTHTLVRDNSRSSRRNSPPSVDFPLPSGQWGEYRIHSRLPSVPPPIAFVMSRSAVICFRYRMIRKNTARILLLWFTLPGERRVRCAFAIALAHRMWHPSVDGGNQREERLGGKIISWLRPRRCRVRTF